MTFCGITAALGVAIMLAGGFLGVMTYAAPLLALIFLVPVLRELGEGYALLAYAATALMTALISPDKELAFCYVFIGAYPVVRKEINRLRPRIVRILLKLLFFAAAVALMYAVLIFLFRYETVLAEMGELGATLFILSDAALVLIFMLFDPILAGAEILYEKRLRPRLGLS